MIPMIVTNWWITFYWILLRNKKDSGNRGIKPGGNRRSRRSRKPTMKAYHYKLFIFTELQLNNVQGSNMRSFKSTDIISRASEESQRILCRFKRMFIKHIQIPKGYIFMILNFGIFLTLAVIVITRRILRLYEVKSGYLKILKNKQRW